MVADINAVHAGKLGLEFFFWSFSLSEGLNFSVGILIVLVIVRVFYTAPRSLFRWRNIKIEEFGILTTTGSLE